MPISRKDFDLGRSEESDETLVLRYLTSHRDQAFRASEIADAIGHQLVKPLKPGTSKAGEDLRELEHSIRLANFENFLVRMASDGKIARKVVEDQSGRGWYFAASV